MDYKKGIKKITDMLGPRHIHISDDSETTALGMPDERFNELIKEIETTKEVDNAISDMVDAKATEDEETAKKALPEGDEETAKEMFLETQGHKTIKVPYIVHQSIEEYHELKVSDLPLYKKYNLYKGYNGDDLTWYYRLAIIDGKQRVHKISINAKDNNVSVYYCDLEDIFSHDNIDSNAEEWHAVVCKLLKILD